MTTLATSALVDAAYLRGLVLGVILGACGGLTVGLYVAVRICLLEQARTLRSAFRTKSVNLATTLDFPHDSPRSRR